MYNKETNLKYKNKYLKGVRKNKLHRIYTFFNI